MTLSKSDYILYLCHSAWLWLKKFNKLPPIDDILQAMFDAGNEFEGYTEQLFPNAIKLGFSNYNKYLTLPTRTKLAIQNKIIQEENNYFLKMVKCEF